MYATASPTELNRTPWSLLGSTPADHCRAAIGCICPPLPFETSTTKPGRFSVSAPNPYSTHEPTLGRPVWIDPLFMNVCAGSWLICSVHIDRSEEHTSELQSHSDLVCRLLLEKKKKNIKETDSLSTITNED